MGSFDVYFTTENTEFTEDFSRLTYRLLFGAFGDLGGHAALRKNFI